MKIYIYSFIAGALLLSCDSRKEKPTKNTTSDESLTVATSVVERISTVELITASGVLSSKSEIKLAFKTGGLIKRMYVSEGQSVREGQLLAEVDTEEIDAQVSQGNVGLEKAKRDYERVKRLVADSAATIQNLEAATSAYEAAKQGLRVGSFNQKLSKIYAPSNGKILRKIAEQGELIAPLSPALILGTGGAATQLNIGVTDRDIVQLKKGYPATVYFDAYPNEIFTAKVSQIAQIINPVTGTFEIELTVNSKGKQLISGFVARAEISPLLSESSLAVPIESLVEADGNQAFVFIFENNKVEKRSIELLKIVGDKVAVKSGLTKGEEVVIKGASFLKDGQLVRRSVGQ
jgi:RND family efflux transporter MFP subunit